MFGVGGLLLLLWRCLLQCLIHIAQKYKQIPIRGGKSQSVVNLARSCLSKPSIYGLRVTKLFAKDGVAEERTSTVYCNRASTHGSQFTSNRHKPMRLCASP